MLCARDGVRHPVVCRKRFKKAAVPNALRRCFPDLTSNRFTENGVRALLIHAGHRADSLTLESLGNLARTASVFALLQPSKRKAFVRYATQNVQHSTPHTTCLGPAGTEQGNAAATRRICLVVLRGGVSTLEHLPRGSRRCSGSVGWSAAGNESAKRLNNST